MSRRSLSRARPWAALLSVAFFLACVVATVQWAAMLQGAEKQKVNITGHYKALGTHVPSNVVYRADIDISKQGDVYRLQWKSGAKVWDGVGIREDDKLVVAQHDLEGKNLAVMVYRIVTVDAGVRLDGRWSYRGDKATSTETLQRVK